MAGLAWSGGAGQGRVAHTIQPNLEIYPMKPRAIGSVALKGGDVIYSSIWELRNAEFASAEDLLKDPEAAKLVRNGAAFRKLQRLLSSNVHYLQVKRVERIDESDPVA